MAFVINQRVAEGITLLDLSGRLTVGDGAAQLRQIVTDLLDAAVVNLILNLHEVDYIDSSGLGTLVLCATQAEDNGAKLKLIGLNGRNIELLVMTKLETVFDTFRTERDAIDSFFPNRELRRFDILDFVNSQKNKTAGS